MLLKGAWILKYLINLQEKHSTNFTGSTKACVVVQSDSLHQWTFERSGNNASGSQKQKENIEFRLKRNLLFTVGPYVIKTEGLAYFFFMIGGFSSLCILFPTLFHFKHD